MDAQSPPTRASETSERETIPQQITRSYYALLPVFERHMGMSLSLIHI